MAKDKFIEFIENFLEKNYSVVTTDVHFNITDKHLSASEKSYTLPKFTDIYIKIFGEFSINGDSSLNILHEWFNEKCTILVKDINDLLETMTNEEGSLVMLNKLITHFQNENGISKYHDAFLISYFNDYYKHTFTIPTLKEIKETFDSGLNSVALLEELNRRLEFESGAIQEFAMNSVNQWYSDTFLGKKLDELFKEFVVTLGPRNWVVTWVGHGVVTNEKLINEFIKETKFQHQLILNKYDHWYTEAVQEASERMMSRGNFY